MLLIEYRVAGAPAAMSVAARARQSRVPPFLDPPGYARHRPEATLLYQLVERHYPAFRELRAEAGRPLPEYVEQEFEAYLECGRLEHGFLRVRCRRCHPGCRDWKAIRAVRRGRAGDSGGGALKVLVCFPPLERPTNFGHVRKALQTQPEDSQP